MSSSISKIARTIFPSLLVLCFGLLAQAQTPRERHERIRASVEARDYQAATNELISLRSADPTVFALNNYDYLLARLAERRGDVATAATVYQAVVARNSLLSQYALWHLAQFARSTGNLTLEREQLRQLIATAPTSLLREAALARLGESFMESRDYASAIAVLNPRAKPTGPATAREALALVGQAKLRSGQTDAARETFNSLLSQLPNPAQPDDYALLAARGLDELDSGSAEAAEQKAPQLPESEHLRRAAVYTFNRDFAGARRHYQAVVERYPQSAARADVLYQIGRGYYQERNFEEAIKSYQRVADEFAGSPSARDAMSFIASSYVRMKRTDEAVAAYKRLIEKYPTAPNPERAYLNIIDALREVGRDAEALDWIEQTRARFKGQVGGALALFSRAKVHMAQGAWAEALADFEALRAEPDLGEMRVPGGTNATEISFLRAYSLERMGRTDEAVATYLEIPEGRGQYYGGRATRRLLALAKDEKTRGPIEQRLKALRTEAQTLLNGGDAERARVAVQRALRLTEDAGVRGELLEMARRAYRSLHAYNKLTAPRLLQAGRQNVITVGPREMTQTPSHQALADELLFLGLYDEGAPELAVARRSNAESGAKSEGQPSSAQGSGTVTKGAAESAAAPASTPASTSSRDAAYSLAVYYKRADMGNHAVAFAEPIWKQVPSDYLLELAPREMVELLYPAPYRAALLESAPPRGVDPRFVLAIMRQESRFRPEAKSVSAARGLTQFIPSTANEIAGQLGLRDFAQDDLYNPSTAVLFASQYMGNLFRQFPDQPQAVAASYNGGEDNVERWIARARSNDPDHYVPEIGFTQAKDYVFKVMPNFWVYQSLYTEKLEPR